MFTESVIYDLSPIHYWKWFRRNMKDYYSKMSSGKIMNDITLRASTMELTRPMNFKFPCNIEIKPDFTPDFDFPNVGAMVRKTLKED